MNLPEGAKVGLHPDSDRLVVTVGQRLRSEEVPIPWAPDFVDELAPAEALVDLASQEEQGMAELAQVQWDVGAENHAAFLCITGRGDSDREFEMSVRVGPYDNEPPDDEPPHLDTVRLGWVLLAWLRDESPPEFLGSSALARSFHEDLVYGRLLKRTDIDYENMGEGWGHCECLPLCSKWRHTRITFYALMSSVPTQCLLHRLHQGGAGLTQPPFQEAMLEESDLSASARRELQRLGLSLDAKAIRLAILSGQLCPQKSGTGYGPKGHKQLCAAVENALNEKHD